MSKKGLIKKLNKANQQDKLKILRNYLSAWQSKQAVLLKKYIKTRDDEILISISEMNNKRFREMHFSLISLQKETDN